MEESCIDLRQVRHTLEKPFFTKIQVALGRVRSVAAEPPGPRPVRFAIFASWLWLLLLDTTPGHARTFGEEGSEGFVGPVLAQT